VFNLPITVPFRDPEGVFPVDLSVPVDSILRVTPLDNDHSFGVESATLYSCLPSTELLLTDGRKLPVLETAAMINRYLDLYRQIEDFYTAPATPAQNSSASVSHLVPNHGAKPAAGGIVIPLFGRTPPCDTSEASTPD
jgi:hypothetical protein